VLAQTDAIRSWLHQREDEMAAFLTELVAIPRKTLLAGIIAAVPNFSQID